ncbi:hypothetical protein UF64_12660 [Thalassospira sp. HJ]|nr:hypothetical protein UF64_12660 [Thalassospira sp. HJ]
MNSVERCAEKAFAQTKAFEINGLDAGRRILSADRVGVSAIAAAVFWYGLYSTWCPDAGIWIKTHTAFHPASALALLPA